MIDCIEIAIKAAIIGYVYSSVLIQPGELLHQFYLFLRRHLTKVEVIKVNSEVPEEISNRIGYIKPKPITREVIHEHWLLKPLGACSKCTSGQIALWLFLCDKISYDWYFYHHLNISTFIDLIFCVCLAILLTLLINRISG